MILDCGARAWARAPRLAALTAIVLATLLSSLPRGATAAPAKPSLSTRVAEQQKELERQRAEVEAQRALIAAQEARLAAQAAQIDSQSVLADTQAVRLREQQAALVKLQQQLEIMQRRLDELSQQAGMPAVPKDLEERLKQIEAASQKSPELPPDIVAAGDFPGSIRIPGSDAAIKFGGRIRTSVVMTLDPLGTDDRFLTNSIPVGDSVTTGDAKRTNISSRASRLNFEFRTPAGLEEVRAFIEGDFAGAANAFRLRHAYAQYRGVIAGQTWSTFSDPGADHLDLDFEGVNAENVIRQPQIRYWWSPRPGDRYAIAAETPLVSITGATGVNLVPDVILRGYASVKQTGHLQVAGVLRQIRAQLSNGVVKSDWAGGGTVSGVLPFKRRGLTDRVIFQVNGGTGIARYINDLNSLGGQDAVVDTVNAQLVPLPAIGWYVSYEHVWKEWSVLEQMNLRSMFMWSYVEVSNTSFQPGDAYRDTHRVAGNAVLSPTKRIDLGVEYIYGSRRNHDGQRGRANQVQVVALIRF